MVVGLLLMMIGLSFSALVGTGIVGGGVRLRSGVSEVVDLVDALVPRDVELIVILVREVKSQHGVALVVVG